MSNLLNIKDENGNWIPIPIATNGIASIIQNSDYTLTITLEDGTVYTTTSIRGEQGAQGIKGDKGDSFTYADFTPEQLASLKGERGEQGIQGVQGKKGDAFTYADFTPEQLASLKGEKGDKGDQGIQGVKGDTGAKGDKGDAFEYSDFTPEQLASLKGEKGDTGNTGAKGDTGDSGVYVGTSAPSDTNVNVWIDSDGDPDDIVTDVQIDGASIVSGGVAEMPKASYNNLGVVKTGNDYGIASLSNGRITVYKADDTQIKSGEGIYKPIVPSNQHNAIFYGLAKAAGYDEKDSILPLGQYSPEAIVAIQKMLGVYQEPFRTIKEITITEETKLIYIDSDEDGNPFALTELIILFDSMVATNSGTGWIVINNNEARILSDSDSDSAVLNAPNVYYSTARTTMSHLWLSGGRFFGEAMDNLPYSYSRASLASCRNSMGLIECDTMNNVFIYSANDHKFTSGTITIIGR